MAEGVAEGPLSGVKVLEISPMVVGPLAGTMLADLGATVIKIADLHGGLFATSNSDVEIERMRTAGTVN